jgi:hypothetical protein
VAGAVVPLVRTTRWPKPLGDIYLVSTKLGKEDISALWPQSLLRKRKNNSAIAVSCEAGEAIVAPQSGRAAKLKNFNELTEKLKKGSYEELLTGEQLCESKQAEGPDWLSPLRKDRSGKSPGTALSLNQFPVIHSVTFQNARPGSGPGPDPALVKTRLQKLIITNLYRYAVTLIRLRLNA